MAGFSSAMTLGSAPAGRDDSLVHQPLALGGITAYRLNDMRFSLASLALASLLVLTARLEAQSRIISVTPETAKAGDEVTVGGEGLDATKVDALFLTNDKEDIQVEMSEQNDKSIKFKVPATVKPGRWALMYRTKEAAPKLMEEPVKLTVE